MGKITDLPNELLSLIFREFLSSTLVDHRYLCQWNLEDDAFSRRANLYRLALACKRLAKVALPLLYEQMFGYEDLQTFAVSGVSIDVIFSQLAYMSYLTIGLKSDRHEDSEVMAMLPAYLSHCGRLHHLKLSFDEISPAADRLLRKLADLPMSQKLGSLTLSSPSSDGHHDRSTVLQDVCKFRNLAGLCFNVDCPIFPPQLPSRYLQHLKELHIEDILDMADLAAVVAVAMPATIQTLSITLHTHHADGDAILHILSGHQWINITRLNIYLHTASMLRILLEHLSLFPVLSHLWLHFAFQVQIKELLPTLPKSLETFEARNLEMHELVDMLDLVKDGSWLRPGLQMIKLDDSNLPDHGYDGSEYTKERILGAAREAILASQAKDVRLEPEDLVFRLQELIAWDWDDEEEEEEEEEEE